jgi:hypothetical protein
MTTDPRVIITRPAGPDGPAVLAVYDDSHRPIVTVPLSARRVLRLARELLAAVEADEIDPPPADEPAHRAALGAVPW